MSSSERPCPSSKPDGPVPALRAGAGGHQVTDAGQAAEREHLASQRDAEPAQLGQAAGDQHGTRVLAEAQAVADAGGDGHHVLGGAGDLAPDDVGAHVDPERPGVHQVLDARGQGLVRQGHHAGGGLPLGHLPGQIRAGQDARPGYREGPAATTSDIRRLVPFSMPLERLMTASTLGDEGRQSLQHGSEAV